jgi:hypothetical protein
MARRNKTGLPAKSFAGIPRIVMDSDDFKQLSGNAVKLLLCLAYQYRGANNGDLTTAFSVLNEKFGFKARGVISRAIRQLLDANLIRQTRSSRFLNPGGQCALYALTWLPIDECPGKRLEVNPTRTPPRKFSLEKNKTPCTESVHGCVLNRYPQREISP